MPTNQPTGRSPRLLPWLPKPYCQLKEGGSRAGVALDDEAEDEHHAAHEGLQPHQVDLGDGDQDKTSC